jgi:hypothetical protein
VSSGTVTVNSTSEEVAGGTFSQSVSTVVLAHAHPSLTSPASHSSATINFGTRAQNSAAMGLGAPSVSLSVFNLPDASGFSSKLDLDSINAAGNTSALSIDLATFTNLAAGSSKSFNALLNTATFGSFSATYTLNLSDQDLPGATSTAPLTLTLIGRIAMAGDANVDGRVNALDFNTLAGAFSQSGRTWIDADFNGDGIVNSIDFSALAQNFGGSYAPSSPLRQLVPEPILMGVIAAAAIVFSRRRKSVSFAFTGSQ